jgi:hypothetical protein
VGGSHSWTSHPGAACIDRRFGRRRARQTPAREFYHSTMRRPESLATQRRAGPHPRPYLTRASVTRPGMAHPAPEPAPGARPDRGTAPDASPPREMEPAQHSSQPSDRAQRIQIHALLGSPHTPARASGAGSSHPAGTATGEELSFPPTMSIGASAVELAAHPNAGPSFRPHPVRQLQGAVAKGRRNKKHICEFAGCGREFSRKSNLEAHNRKHMTGAQATPYVCVYGCRRRFKWRSSLKSHEAGCMHMSLPMAIQQRERQQQQFLQQQQDLLQEQQQQRQPAPPPAKPIPLGQNSLLAAASAAAAAASPSPAGQTSPTRLPQPEEQAQMSNGSGAGPWPAAERPHEQAPPSNASAPPVLSPLASALMPPVSRPESHGMLSSLRRPPPGAFDQKPPGHGQHGSPLL